jgi:hypothetical protein
MANKKGSYRADPNKRIGEVFNSYKIIEFPHRNKWNALYYRCQCVCGKEKIVQLSNLKTGSSNSCGCQSTRPQHYKRKPIKQLCSPQRLNELFRIFKVSEARKQIIHKAENKLPKTISILKERFTNEGNLRYIH